MKKICKKNSCNNLEHTSNMLLNSTWLIKETASEDDIVKYGDSVRKMREKVNDYDYIDDCFRQLLQQIRDLDCAYSSDISPFAGNNDILYFPLFKMATLLGIKPPKSEKSVANFLAKYGIEDECSCRQSAIFCDCGDDPDGNVVSVCGVSHLIWQSKFPKWLKQKLDTWFIAYVAEWKARDFSRLSDIQSIRDPAGCYKGLMGNMPSDACTSDLDKEPCRYFLICSKCKGCRFGWHNASEYVYCLNCNFSLLYIDIRQHKERWKCEGQQMSSSNLDDFIVYTEEPDGSTTIQQFDGAEWQLMCSQVFPTPF